jgi:Ca2+-binding EF-hand superfamily protein
MQKKTKLFLAAGAVAVLAIGGVASLASAEMGGGHGRRMGGHGGGHHGMMGMQMMERYDANKDGKLSQEEIDTNRTSWHGEFDGDKNATLSLDEFKSLWLKARQEDMVREFQQFDRDGNGQVTLDEYKQPMAGMVANMDHNNDGVLSKDDRQHMKGKRGDRMRRHGQGQGMGMGDVPAPAETESGSDAQ